MYKAKYAEKTSDYRYSEFHVDVITILNRISSSERQIQKVVNKKHYNSISSMQQENDVSQVVYTVKGRICFGVSICLLARPVC